MNRFAYAEANPWTFSDPSGHATCFSSSDLCDETMAIRHQGTAAGRDAVRRSGSRTKVNHWYNRALKAKAPARIYETNPKATPETASTDEGWGEAASIGRASATETAAQAAAVKCTQTRLGASCQTAQQQADAAATTAGIGDAFGDIWNSALHLGSCVGNILNCADVGLGLAMTVTNPGGTSQAMAAQRWAAIQSGDKRAGAHAITSTLIDFASILPLFGALKAATVADAAAASRTASLFRNVGTNELADLLDTGAFRSGGTSMAGKWFWEELASAEAFKATNFGKPHIVSVRVPKDFVNSLFNGGNNQRWDGIGRARYVDEPSVDQLNSLMTDFTVHD